MRGETLGIVGETGCGKSTTARLLVRLLDPTSGEILFEGEDIAARKGAELKALRREMQMIFQDPVLVAEPAQDESARSSPSRSRSTGCCKGEGERKQRVQELMDRSASTPSTTTAIPHEFSGGQRQRIGVARAIALEPKLLVADEPVSALDVSIQAQVLNLLRRLQREMGLTLIFIAHDLSVVRHMCDRVAVMYLGKIVELAPSDALYCVPAPPLHRRAAVGRSGSRSRGGAPERQLLTGDVPSPANPPSACRFHTRCPKAQEHLLAGRAAARGQGRRNPRGVPLPAHAEEVS